VDRSGHSRSCIGKAGPLRRAALLGIVAYSKGCAFMAQWQKPMATEERTATACRICEWNGHWRCDSDAATHDANSTLVTELPRL
jgi:hypothetical protein